MLCICCTEQAQKAEATQTVVDGHDHSPALSVREARSVVHWERPSAVVEPATIYVEQHRQRTTCRLVHRQKDIQAQAVFAHVRRQTRCLIALITSRHLERQAPFVSLYRLFPVLGGVSNAAPREWRLRLLESQRSNRRCAVWNVEERSRGLSRDGRREFPAQRPAAGPHGELWCHRTARHSAPRAH